MTELEKYEGIYSSPGKYPQYGRSNHGEKAVLFVQKWAPDSVLDVGCGFNDFIKSLRAIMPGLDALGVDFACPGADRLVTATAMPFADKEWDLLTAFDMLEHVAPDDVDKTLSEMSRVSKRFIFSISHVPSVNKWMGETLHPTVQPETWWMTRLMRAGALAIKKHGHFITGRWGSALRIAPDASVVVVGNGPSILMADNGEAIDAHDEVIRFNSFQIAGFEKHTGTRTTLWSRIFHEKPAVGECMRILCKHERDEVPGDYAEVYRIPEMYFNRLRVHVQQRVEWTSGFRRDTQKILASSGLLAVAWLLEVVGVDRVTLAGFDHFSKDKTWQHEYFSPQRYTKPREHEGDVEAIMFKELEAAGRVCRL